MKTLINFRLSGRFAHFLRAEAGVSALSYPVPPRTVLMGMIGAVLGIEKDRAQVILEPMEIAVAGSLPMTHWHKVKLRKDPPELLSHIIKKSQKSQKNTKPEKPALIKQEWLFNPEYTVWVSLPEPYHHEFELRLKEQRWHFQPYLGLSEMAATLEYLESIEVEDLPESTYLVESIIRQEQGELDITKIYEEGISLHLLRMPRTVTAERVFTHNAYIAERDNRPISVRTDKAYKAGRRVLMFL